MLASTTVAVRGYLGCYGDSIGILTDGRDGLSVSSGPAATNPSYLTASPTGKVIYAVFESFSGGIGAYAVDGEQLMPLGERPSGGDSPCHLSVHDGHLLVAHYGSGSVAVFPIKPDGSLAERSDLVRHAGSGPHPERQGHPHTHMIVPEPSGRYVLAIDLGTDSIYRYVLTDGRLQAAGAAPVPAGAGPRHVAFHPSGRFGYVANELDSTVSVLDLETFTVGATVSTVDSAAAPGHPSAIRIAADGQHCYVANRGPDTIAVLDLPSDGADLRLTATVPAGGAHPRDIVLDGDRAYVANEESGTVTSLRVDRSTGALEPEGVLLETQRPACLLLR